jgi:hypothetical protein
MKVRLMLRRENAVPAVWGSRDLSAEFGASTVTQGLARKKKKNALRV